MADGCEEGNEGFQYWYGLVPAHPKEPFKNPWRSVSWISSMANPSERISKKQVTPPMATWWRGCTTCSIFRFVREMGPWERNWSIGSLSPAESSLCGGSSLSFQHPRKAPVLIPLIDIRNQVNTPSLFLSLPPPPPDRIQKVNCIQ